MPIVNCQVCGKNWIDTKFNRCPACGASESSSIPLADVNPQVPAEVAVAAAPGAAPAPPMPHAQNVRHAQHVPPAHRTAPPAAVAQSNWAVGSVAPRGYPRIDVASRAQLASRIMGALATIVAILGAVGIFGALIAVFTLDMWTGLLSGLAVALVSAANWAWLTLASVVAGYVANRS